MYAAAEAYAQKVAEMTKETFLPISCGDLEEVIKNNKFGKKIFVYFGASDSLNKKMSHLHEVAIFDRFNFHQDSPATFYLNSDKVCKISQGFQKPGPAIGLYLHSDVPMISFFDERDDMNSPT